MLEKGELHLAAFLERITWESKVQCARLSHPLWPLQSASLFLKGDAWFQLLCRWVPTDRRL